MFSFDQEIGIFYIFLYFYKSLKYSMILKHIWIALSLSIFFIYKTFQNYFWWARQNFVTKLLLMSFKCWWNQTPCHNTYGPEKIDFEIYKEMSEKKSQIFGANNKVTFSTLKTWFSHCLSLYGPINVFIGKLLSWLVLLSL